MARTTSGVRRWGSVLLALVAAAAVPDRAAGQPDPVVACRRSGPPGCREHHYTVAARVRPLLFWIAKDNVGEARLTWLGGEAGERGFGLLIGSDPKRAPRKINKWGYVSEIEEQGQVRVFGLMTEADEESYEEAKAATGKVPDGSQVYKVIYATVGEDKATSAVHGVALSDRFTLRDLDSVVAQVPAPAVAITVPLPPGTERGFLFAMTSLLHENVDVLQRTGAPPAGTRRSYVYGKKFYSVATRSSKFLKRLAVKGREFENVIESEFHAKAATKSKGDTFRVVYGTEGALREVPLRIVYRPNWWFEAEVVLADGADAGRGRARQ